VLLTEGGDFDKLGRGFVWNGELPECIHQNHVFAVRVDQSQLDPHFFSYQAQSPHGKQYFLSVAHKTTNLACINTTKLKAFPVRIPPLSEQKEIVHILSTVQRAIKAQEQIIQSTTELKKALMQKLFSEGLRGEPQKETEIGLVPESWGIVPFDKFVTLQRGYDLRKQDFRSGSVPVIGATQLIGYHDTANVKAPGVTVVRSGTSAGKPLFISEDFWAHNVLLYVKDFQGNIPRFVYYKILALNLAQYRQGVAVPTLNRNTFSAIKLALPSTSEQHDIADALDAVVNRMEVAKREKFQKQDLLRTLLCELMSAKIRVCTINLPDLQ
jgi:type I restriction enzyme S subunit